MRCAVATRRALDVVAAVMLMSRGVFVCRKSQLGGSLHRRAQNGSMEMQQQHRPEGASSISPDGVRLLPDQQTDGEQQPPPAVLDGVSSIPVMEAEQGQQKSSGR